MFNRMKLMLAVALGRMMGSAPLSLHRAAMDHNRTADVLRAAAGAVGSTRRLIANSAARLMPLSRAKGNGYKGPNGAQAMARRVRQLVTGHASAGLLFVQPDGSRWSADSHGVFRRFYC